MGFYWFQNTNERFECCAWSQTQALCDTRVLQDTGLYSLLTHKHTHMHAHAHTHIHTLPPVSPPWVKVPCLLRSQLSDREREREGEGEGEIGRAHV